VIYILQIIRIINFFNFFYCISDTSETYTWGDNSNFTLGHASEQRRSNPEALEVFRKLKISVKDVRRHCSVLHSLFITALL